MKPYTFPICKMLYDTTGTEPRKADTIRGGTGTRNAVLADPVTTSLPAEMQAVPNPLTSQFPSPTANREAGPLESPLLAASLPTFNCRVCRRTLVPMAIYSDGAIDTYEYCHVHYKQRVEEHNFNGLLKACSDNQREERYRR